MGLGLLPTCLDTYLSPNGYSGLSLSYDAEQWNQSRWGDGRLFVESFSHTTFGLAVFGTSSSELLAMEDYSFAMPWLCWSNDKVRLYAGAEAQVRAGALWNPRNSNNPVSAKAGLHLGGMAMAEFHYTMDRFPARTSVTFDMPLVGTFFSPEYTQSYYELYYMSGILPCLHLATPVNCLSGRGRVVTDITFSECILRLSLMEDNYRWHTSSNRYALHTYSFGVGFVFNSYRIHPHENVTSILPY